MADNLTCEVCGGTDFMKEAGFYFCNECQTQTQELREQHYEMEETLAHTRLKTKTIRTKASSDSNVKLTTWEGYNYILAGLVKELINVGAKPELKEVTHNLWIAYLMKLEILSKKANTVPKLGITYKKKDAEIVYQHQQKKKLRKTLPSISYATSIVTDSTDLKILQKEKARNKRALVRTEYEAFTTNTQSSDNQSLLNKTLSNVGSSDDESGKVEKRVRYNRAARKELLKHMSYSHLQNHSNDFDGNLKCHKTKYEISSSYYKSPFILSRNKLYSILYIGLLLTEDDIQLSDILRFCREGHLSFLSYNHLFPENFSEKQINPMLYQDGIKTVPSHKDIRQTVYRIQNLLQFKTCNFCPDLKKLSERYCTEMNLPDEINSMVKNLIDKTKPMLKLRGQVLPNYEGRVMAFVLYILKLLFGLDGVTEFKMSTFAEDLNRNEQFCGYNKMFVFSDWIKYIEYRKLILKEQHFPTCYLLNHNGTKNSNLFLNFLQKQERDEECSIKKQNLSMDIVQKLLKDLVILQNSTYKMYLDFRHSLTPMHTHMQTILEQKDVLIHGRGIEKDVLQTFTNTKLDFLLNCKKYLKKLNNKNYTIIDKNANSNCHFTEMKSADKVQKENFETYVNEWTEAFEKIKIDEFSLETLQNTLIKKKLKIKSSENHLKDLPVHHKEINKDLIINLNNRNNKDRVGRDRKGRFCSVKSSEKVESHEYPTPRKRGKWFISSWTENPLLDEHHFNPLYVVTKGRSLENIVETKLHKNNKKRKHIEVENGKKYNVHFLPYMEYWINVADMKVINRFKWKELEASLPSTFRWVLNECARTIEQTPKDLFTEFVAVELYVTYIYLQKSPTCTSNGNDNSTELSKIISKISKDW